MQRQKRYEDYGYVLDVFPASQHRVLGQRFVHDRNEYIVQLLGEDYFTLLEVAVNEKFKPKHGTRLYIGRDVPREILRIVRRIDFSDLTDTAIANLEPAVHKIVNENPNRFLDIINNSGLLTPRLHTLELIPGIGKKMLQKFLQERERGPFTSYEDIKNRTGHPNPSEAICKRIVQELRDREEKYRIFVREPVREFH
jgi:putative nucleotide binding protein